jgi:hypothetical protein
MKRPVRSPARRLDDPTAMTPIQRSGGTKRRGPRAARGPGGSADIVIVSFNRAARTLTMLARDS